MYSLLREYPWLRPYWYATLAVIALAGVLMILWDGKTQVAKGRARAAQLQRKQKQQALAAAAQEGGTAGTAVTVDSSSGERVDGSGVAQQRRPARKTVS